MKIGKNALGTLDFVHKFEGMRKEQEFTIYPKSKEENTIAIQSDSRIGKLDLITGKGIISASHSNGAYFHTLTMDILKKKAKNISLNNEDLTILKNALNCNDTTKAKIN
jgi:hypothetical protein